MQIFSCPFCGKRPETEFHYGGEAGNLRPQRAGDEVAAQSWASYLYFRANPKGTSREIWAHTACGELFVMERDTVTHEVVASAALAEGNSE
jgi:sarcosine oxidase, subunit delta